MQLDLKMIQTDNGIEYPINLSGEAAGMVESGQKVVYLGGIYAGTQASTRAMCAESSAAL